MAIHRHFRVPPINLRASVEALDTIHTIPQLIDWNAEHNANEIFCYQAIRQSNDTTKANSVSITHSRLRNAIRHRIQRLARIITELKLYAIENVGRNTKGPPVALFVESDVSLLFHLFALMGLGVPVLLLSARLSPVAVCHLLKTTRTAAIITSKSLQNTVKKALDQLKLSTTPRDLPKLYVQEPFEWDLDPEVDVYDLDKIAISGKNHFTDDKDRNVLILHSSGTTGLPKPIYQPHRYLLSYAVCHIHTEHEDIGGLNMSTLPLYHGFGLVAPCLSLGLGKPCWLQPAHVIPTGFSTAEVIESNGAKSLMTVPVILEEIALLPEAEGIQRLLSLQFVASAGGPLKASVGEKLASRGVKVLMHFGTTETGPIAPIFAPPPEYDWRYFRLRQDIEVSVEPTGQLENGPMTWKLTTYPFGWDSAYELQDNFENNPLNPTTDFRAIGRTDDLIVLATGEKILPRILEQALSESPLVKAAVVFGDGRFEVGVIVEPTSFPVNFDIEDFKTAIWPVIVESGDKMDSHARISSKQSIIVACAGVSIPRSDKGSVLRRECYRIFEQAIEQVYTDLENVAPASADQERLPQYNLLDMQDLKRDLKIIIQTQLVDWNVPPDQDWGFEDDFFELGMNSLQALQLRRILARSFAVSNTTGDGAAERVQAVIGTDFVYRNPSIAKMAHAIEDAATTVGGDGVQTVPDCRKLNGDQGHRDSIERFVRTYSLRLSENSSILTKTPINPGHVVLLTGSTGSLGSHILAHLVTLPQVARVICLSRLQFSDGSQGSDPYERQRKALKSKHLKIPADLLRSKAEVMSINPAADAMGLSGSDYARLISQVTHIMHVAWPMDFKRTLPSFETQFCFLRNLLLLAKNIHGTRRWFSMRPRVLFVSSIAVVGRYSLAQGRGRIVPEVPVVDEDCVINDFGYGQAKLVCERMVEDVAKMHGREMEAFYVRVGQLAGSSESGFWNTNEHFPQLMRLAQYIGKLPDLKGTLSWIPVNLAAQVLSEIIFAPGPVETVYHLENPIRQSWHDMLLMLAPKLSLSSKSSPSASSSSSDFISFHDWLDLVVQRATNTGNYAAKSGDDDTAAATMLVEFLKQDFTHMSGGDVVLGTDNARRCSTTLRDMDGIGEEIVRKFVEGWRESGFLH